MVLFLDSLGILDTLLGHLRKATIEFWTRFFREGKGFLDKQLLVLFIK